MQWGRIFRIVVLSGILVAGCSKLPGLRVLTGQDAQNASSSGQTVQSLNLVMADKSGGADSSLTAAADRIEAADDMVDIIEIRKDATNRVAGREITFPGGGKKFAGPAAAPTY